MPCLLIAAMRVKYLADGDRPEIVYRIGTEPLTSSVTSTRGDVPVRPLLTEDPAAEEDTAPVAIVVAETPSFVETRIDGRSPALRNGLVNVTFHE